MNCARCGSNIEATAVRMLEEGGSSRCSCCTLALPVLPRDWLINNGYNVEED